MSNPASPASLPPPAGWEDILAPGETILWQGQPDGRVAWSDLVSPVTFMGVFFTGFSAFWISMAAFITSAGAGSAPGPFRLFPLFGLPFFAVGLYMLGGRLIWDAWQRRGTHYTLTSRAGYIATSLIGRRRLAVYPVDEMKIELEDGEPGTVWFAEKVAHRAGGYSGTGSSRRYRGPSVSVTPIGFRRVPDARKVYRLCRDAQQAAKSPAGATAPVSAS